MSREKQIISEEIREEILIRSLSANSNREVANVVVDSIVAAGVDWRSLQLDDVKAVLVDGIRASKGEEVLSFKPLVV